SIRHGARRHKQGGLFAEHLRAALLQAIDGRVFAINVVADFGFEHCLAHRGSGFGNGVATEIDHIKEAKTSLDRRTPRGVSFTRSPSVSRSPSRRNCWMDSEFSFSIPRSNRSPRK